MNSFLEAFFNTNHQPPSLPVLLVIVAIVIGVSLLRQYAAGRGSSSQKPKKKRK